MKYKDLPKYDTIIKLVQVCFSTPQKNIMMYKLYNYMKENIIFIESEKNKLLKKYGIDEGNGKYTLKGENYVEYVKAWNDLLECEIEGELPKVDFNEDDFNDDKCSYPPEKDMWPSGLDIATLLNLCNVMEKEKSGE